MEKEKILEIKNLKKHYGQGEGLIRALNDVSFDVYKGELLVILGSSGSGKSTLLNIIGGMDSPSEGEVLINSRDISKFKDKELTNYRAKNIGFIFQFYNLIPDLTALENVMISISGKDAKQLALSKLKEVGLEGKEYHYPSQLSGGEQQRVSIARALVKNAEIILCDEPTGALDYQTGRQILVLLEKIAKDKKQTMIFVTHTSSIASMADRIITLRSGKIESIVENKDKKEAKDIEW